MRLSEHNKELLDTLNGILATRGSLVGFKYAPKVLCEGIAKRDDVSNRIRKLHDFFGNVAKYHEQQGCWRGHCAGAIYRTEKFMTLSRADSECKRDDPNPNHRNGTKNHLTRRRTVHIEHTVPVNTLFKGLNNSSRTARQVFEFLMRNSVCTAFHFDEEKQMKPAKVEAANNRYFDDGNGESKIFKRYLPMEGHLRIFNCYTQEEVNPETYTLEMHWKTIADMNSNFVPGIFDPSTYHL